MEDANTSGQAAPFFRAEASKQQDLFGLRHFEIHLSRENLAHYHAGCPEIDHLYGTAEDVSFEIYNGIHREPSRFTNSGADGRYLGYFPAVKAPDPFLPKEEYNAACARAEAELERHLDGMTIPLTMPIQGIELLVGAAHIRVEHRD